jgi:2,5-furandicarboxylate decarboxylase 1
MPGFGVASTPPLGNIPLRGDDPENTEMTADGTSGKTDPRPDTDTFRLRRFIERLANTEELDTRGTPTALADVAAILESNPRAVWFRKAGPDGQDLVGGVCASRTRLAHAFGVEIAGLAAEIGRRTRNAPRLIEIERVAAPCQQVVLEGDAADLTRLPVHLQHGSDGGPYISSALDFTIDAATGLTNVGIRRLMLRGPREAGVDLIAPSDLRAMYEASSAAGRHLPVAFVVGSHPVDHVAGTMRLPVDELGLISSLRGAPVATVKCITSDIRVPADAEYVLEGYFDAQGYTEMEGPYGEFLGYYGAVKRNPVFRLTAITHRKDALFQTSTISGASLAATDTAMLNAIRTEVIVWNALALAVREPLGVYVTGSSGGSFNVRVKMRQRVPGEARNAIHACFGCLANVKNVFVVDPDIDIADDKQMDWALATRFQPDRDLIIASGTRTLALDPSLNGARVGGKAGYDLTWPLGAAGKLEYQVPAPPTYAGKRFSSVEQALADGPKFFEELMAATASDDGREIVRALDTLRKAGRLDRDPERGRWLLKPA